MQQQQKSELAKLFGGNLRRERVACGLTQEKLAEYADMHIRAIQRIEAGERDVYISTAFRLQQALGCPWEKLMKMK